MSLEDKHARLREAVAEKLDGIIDPCSHSSGAPAGLMSMGLVGGIDIEDRAGDAHVKVTLYITEPGCMGVASVEVVMDYAHVWDPEQMAPAYRERLAKARACRAQYMREQFMTQEKAR